MARSSIAVAAAFGAGLVGGHMMTAEVTEPPATEVVQPLPDSVRGKAERAGATGAVSCARGVISNAPDRVYCTDGGTAGFFVTESEAAEMGIE